MSDQFAPANIILILVTIFISYKGFKEPFFFDRYKFEVWPILKGKEYYRIISSSFLHANWPHLIFNMMTLYFFGLYIELKFGIPLFLLFYFISFTGGDLLSLRIHKNHYDYSAIGASGGVSGIVFASIFLFPDISIGFFLLPIGIPGYIYAILFLGISIYGIKSQHDNIGHEAHLGGAITGMLMVAIVEPKAIQQSLYLFMGILISVTAFLVVYLKLPFLANTQSLFSRKPKWSVIKSNKSIDDETQLTKEKEKHKKELDQLLEKISRVGLAGLTEKEREDLNKISTMMNRKN